MEERKGKLETEDDVLALYYMIRCNGIACRWSGICIWIEQAVSDKQRAQLQTMGARWSERRGQWYFRAADGLPKVIAGMEEVA